MIENFPYLFAIALNILRYFLFAGIPFLVFYILFPKLFQKNKIQGKRAKSKDFKREILYSIQTTFILAAMGFVLMNSPLSEFTKVYSSLSDYSLWWIPLSLIFALILHDTYFYWLHRVMHHPKLFLKIHKVHHESINPSPWTSYSFHLYEGILESLVAPVILLLVPMHPVSLFLFALSSFAINVYGHLGYEIMPKWFRHSLLFEFINTSTHHNYHHLKFNGNYGLYFRFWDRIMKTEHPNYVEEYDRIQESRFPIKRELSILRKAVFIVFILLALIPVSLFGQNQTTIEGKWKDPESGGVIRIYKKDSLFFGQLISAKDSTENQLIKDKGEIILMKNFERVKANEYCCGTIFQPRKKRVVTAKLVLINSDELKIIGFYHGFSASRTWERL